MTSLLSRRVFQQLITDEFFLPRHCPRAARLASRQRATQAHGRRSLFGFGGSKNRQDGKTQAINPGLATMKDLGDRLALKVRPQPREELYDALTKFLGSKNGRSRDSKLTDLQIEHCLATFQYLQMTASDGTTGLGLETLGKCLRLLFPLPNISSGPESSTDEKRLVLAKLVYEEALRQDQGKSRETSIEANSLPFERLVLKRYLKIMGSAGQAEQALDVLGSYLNNGGATSNERALWEEVVRATLKSKDQRSLQKLLDRMAGRGINYDTTLQEVVIEALVAQDDLAGTKIWYSRPLPGGESPSKRIKRMVAETCMKEGETEFGQSVVADLVKEPRLDLEDWNVVLSWAVITGKGSEEVERLLKVMERRSREDGTVLRADTTTLNLLVKAALWQNNGYQVERVLSLGRDLGLRPDAETWIMQVDHRLNHGDLVGAVGAYEKVRSLNYELDRGQDAPAINRLIACLCEQADADMDQVLSLVSELLDRQLPFEPATVAALATFHMRRDELHNAIDILRTYPQNFDQDSRLMIRDAIVKLCLDSSTDDAIAWDAYVIVHELFNESSRQLRESIMTAFFNRRRPDMAVHVFGHLRQSPLPDLRPSAQSYQKCFEGIALSGGDEEILDTVHNMLKLDQQVDPDTHLNNALMMAHISARKQERALKLWREITESDEGPSYESIRIAFWACEGSSRSSSSSGGRGGPVGGGVDGETEARRTWNQLHELGVEVTRDMYISYLWALAGQGQLEEAQAMVDGLEERFGAGAGADVRVLGILSNATRLADRGQLAQWARARYPTVWQQVEASDKVIVAGAEFQYENYDIDRAIRS